MKRREERGRGGVGEWQGFHFINATSQQAKPILNVVILLNN
jgi:hypothetical protein